MDATQRTGQKWDTLISRLEVLAQYDSNLEPTVKSALQIQRLYLTDIPDLESVQRLLEEFRLMLKDDLDVPVIKQQHQSPKRPRPKQ